MSSSYRIDHVEFPSSDGVTVSVDVGDNWLELMPVVEAEVVDAA